MEARPIFFFLFTIFNFYLAASQNFEPFLPAQVEQQFIPQPGAGPLPAVQPPGTQLDEGPTEVCIGCICEGASNCNRTLGCAHGMCGLFRMTKPYWVDAGRPVINGDDPNDESAWERCAIDPFCAGQAVLAYTGRFRKDCNNDGRIDCRDFARIHHLGGYGCSGNMDSVFERRFNQCVPSLEGK